MFFDGVTTKEGDLSSWGGHGPIRFSPWRLSETPLPFTTATRSTSRLRRSSSDRGMRDNFYLRKHRRKASEMATFGAKLEKLGREREWFQDELGEALTSMDATLASTN